MNYGTLYFIFPKKEKAMMYVFKNIHPQSQLWIILFFSCLHKILMETHLLLYQEFQLYLSTYTVFLARESFNLNIKSTEIL